jgi:hypothetical protein
MSLVDVRYPALDLFLQRWHGRLNRRWLAGEALAAWTVTGAVLLPLAWFFPHSIGWWTGAAAGSALGYLLWRLPSRLTKMGAAIWLDDRCRTQGLFTAAAHCLDSESEFAGGVLETAEKTSGGVKPLQPWRRLLFRGLLAAAVTAAAFVSFEAPSLLPGRAIEPPAPSVAGQSPATPPKGSPGELQPGDAARKLFAENPRLAALAEQALTDGGQEALKALLQQAQESQSLPGTEKSEGRPRPGPNLQQRPNADQGRQGEPRGDQSPGAGGQAPPQPGDKSASGDQGQGGNGGGKGSVPRRPDEGSGSGRDPGKGHSTTPLGSVQPGPRNSPLALKEPSAAGLFEFALPGAGPRLPSAETLAAAQRSAESRIGRTDPPLEFQSTIRDYFLSLNQEVSP